MVYDSGPIKVSRRSALGLGLASLGTVASAAVSGAESAPVARVPIRFDDPIWNREAAARLEADTNGEQVYGRCTGVICGVRPGEAVRPMLTFEVFSTIRVLRQSDGSYQRMTKETILYTDPKTGAILDEWDNPYTGERVRVVHVANDPYNWIIASTVQPPAMPGLVTTGQAVPGGKPYLLNWTDFWSRHGSAHDRWSRLLPKPSDSGQVAARIGWPDDPVLRAVPLLRQQSRP